MGLDMKMILNFVVAGVVLALLNKFVLSKIPFLNYEGDSDYEE